MNNYKITYTPIAKDDLKSIYSYIAFSLKEPTIAKKQVNAIRGAIRELNFSPERYSLVEWAPWDSMGMRKFPVGNYIIYYLVDNKNFSVLIIRIFYGGRNVEKIINEE